MRRPLGRAAWALGVSGALAGAALGCGASRQSPGAAPERPVRAPGVRSEPATTTESLGDPEDEGAAPSFAEPGASGGAHPFAPPPTGAAALSQALDEFERAAAELDAASGQCLDACRALGSMRRSAERICLLSSDADARCTRARTRLSEARGRVVRGCGACPD